MGMALSGLGPWRSHGEIHILEHECQVVARKEFELHWKGGVGETPLRCLVWALSFKLMPSGSRLYWPLAIRVHRWFAVTPRVLRKWGEHFHAGEWN